MHPQYYLPTIYFHHRFIKSAYKCKQYLEPSTLVSWCPVDALSGWISLLPNNLCVNDAYKTVCITAPIAAVLQRYLFCLLISSKRVRGMRSLQWMETAVHDITPSRGHLGISIRTKLLPWFVMPWLQYNGKSRIFLECEYWPAMFHFWRMIGNITYLHVSSKKFST